MGRPDPTTRLRHILEQMAQLRRQRDEEIANAARAGVQQKDLVQITGLSRETIRQIERAHGIASRRGITEANPPMPSE